MIMVTGASGFIGINLIRKLSTTFSVLATDIVKSPEIDYLKQVVFEQGDISNYSFQKKLIEGYPISSIIHLAAEKSLNKCETDCANIKELNVKSALSLYDLAFRHDIQFVFMSSDQVFDGKKGSYTEYDEKCPINQYGRFKDEVENGIINCKGAAICRTALVFGRIPLFMYPQLLRNCKSEFIVVQSEIIQHICFRLAQNKKIILPADEYVSPTYVGLLVKQLCTIIEKKLTGVFHCCGPERISRYELGVKLAGRGDFDKNNIVRSSSTDKLRPKDVSMNSDYTQKKLGFQFTALDKTLDDVLI